MKNRLIKLFRIALLTANICICFTVFPAVGDIDPSENAGLRFAAHDVSPEKRTSLDLTAVKPFRLPDGFSLRFDLSLRQELHNYGYIVRIIVNDTLNIDIVTNAGWEHSQFSFIKGRKAQIELPLLDSIPEFGFGKWLGIAVGADYRRQMITLNLNGREYEVATALPRMKHIRIVFGRNSHNPFANIDVPPMSLRKVKIYDTKGRLLYDWPLLNHGEGFVCDEQQGLRAMVENGTWNIDRHLYWQKFGSFPVRGYIPQLAYYCRRKDNGFYIATKDTLYEYSLPRNALTSQPFTGEGGGFPYRSSANSLLFESSGNRLISYSIETDTLNRYNFASGTWDRAAGKYYFSLLHHNSLILADRNELAVFGGYDHYRYHATLYVQNLNGGGWCKTDLSPGIEPRYLSAMTYAGSGKLFVLGGYGSKSGRQEEFPTTYYDLHEIDVGAGKQHLVWTFDSRMTEVFGNEMVIDSLRSRFYALSYLKDRTTTRIRLNSFGFDTADRRILADSIPFTFYDVQSYCTLIRDTLGQRLVAVVVEGRPNEISEVTLYGLDFPPLDAAQIIQHGVSDSNKRSEFIWEVLLAGCLLVLGILARFRKRGRSKWPTGTPAPEDVPIPKVPRAISETPERFALHLLGNFQATDAAGKDVTAAFSQTLRNIFIYLVLCRVKDGSGVTSQQLDDLFWEGDDHPNAANKRNVAMSRLRALLRQTSLAELAHKNGLWQISLNGEVFCDFAEMYMRLKEVAQQRVIGIASVRRIAELGSRGTLLANIEDAWADKFKSDYMFLLSDVMQKIYEYPDVQGNLSLWLRLADMMLAGDPLDEDAIRCKCHALYAFGKTRQAKAFFEAFREEYRRTLGEDSKLSFDEIVKI